MLKLGEGIGEGRGEAAGVDACDPEVIRSLAKTSRRSSLLYRF